MNEDRRSVTVSAGPAPAALTTLNHTTAFVVVRAVTACRQVATKLPDIAALAIVLAVCLVTIRPLLSGRDAATGAGDWHAHAFRIDELGRNGPASWSHTWAGGMPLWEGYQALPHVLAVVLVRATGLQTTVAMLVLVASLVVLLRLSTYAALRWAGASPPAALVGVLTAATLDTLRQPAANYSELWGLALSPLALVAGYRWSGRWGGFIVAALVGLSVEVHPLLAVTGGLAMAAGYLSSPRGRSLRLLVLQASLTVTGAAVFWLPVAWSSRPAYGEPYFASVEFSRLLFRLSGAGFLPGWPLAAAAAALVGVAALRGRQSGPHARFLLVAGGAVMLVVGAGLFRGVPEAVYGAQLTRLISVVPLLVGGAAALAATAASRDRGGRAAVRLIAVALAAAAITRGGSGPLDVTKSADAASALPDAVLAAATDVDGRIWLDPVMNARVSYTSAGSVRLAGSYSGREWSLLHGPLEYFLAGHGSARNRAAYLVVHGVGAMVAPADVRPSIVDPRDGDTPLEWRTVANVDGYDVIAPPWPVSAAWLLPERMRRELVVPDLRFRDVESSYIRDGQVVRLAATALNHASIPASVRYPDGGSISIGIQALERGRFLAVSENWDRHWQATAGRRRLPVERFGPNLIGVDIGELSGDVEVSLTHQRPAAAPVGLALSMFALVAAATMTLTRSRGQGGMMQAEAPPAQPTV